MSRVEISGVTEEERAAWYAAASLEGRSFSEWARKRLLGVPTTTAAVQMQRLGGGGSTPRKKLTTPLPPAATCPQAHKHRAGSFCKTCRRTP